MKALVWHGKNDVRVERVPDPEILNPRDAIIKVTTTAICGSDLHLLDGFIPTMQSRRHSGPRVHGRSGRRRQGESHAEDRRSRGRAVHDRLRQLFLLSAGAVVGVRQLQPEREDGRGALRLRRLRAVRLFAHDGRVRGRAGQYVRVPFADVGPMKVPDSLADEQVLFLTDIFPTGYMAAENCNIQPGDIIAVWGCGPVGQMAIASALMLVPRRSLPSTACHHVCAWRPGDAV